MLQRIKHYFNSPTKVTFYLLLTVMLWTTFNIERWKQAETNGKLIAWDVTSYYGYLPALFIHNDLKLDFIDTDGVNYGAKQQFWPERLDENLERDPNGKIKVIKTTMGMAFMYAPFFFLAHGFAHVSKYDTNGFSQPYEFFLVFSCLFYLFVGFYYLRKILLLSFSEWVSSITMVSILIGTNLFYYATEEPAMSHAYSFSLITCFIYQSINWLTNYNLKRAIYIGLLGGLIVLIRPVNIIIFLFPLLYGVSSGKLFVKRIKFFLTNWKHILIIAILSFLVLLPQFIYWKAITGNWLFNSYVGEQFYFNNPHILEGLFSYRKGWLVYSPIMLFSLLGLVLLFKRKREYFSPVLVFVLINTTLLYSWWAWWYGGSFGSRPMIDSYGLLAIPMACFYTAILKNKYLYLPILTVLVLLIGVNQVQTFQRRKNIIHWDSMTKNAYWNVFLKTKLTAEEWAQQEKFIQPPDYDLARNGKDEYVFNPF